MNEGKDAEFPETSWTMVRKARDFRGDAAAFRALSQLCEAYWFPLYAFLRQTGMSPEDAKDTTQSFFAALIDRNYLESVRQEKGKLRTFLIDALKKHRAKGYRADMAQKRGGHITLVHIDEGEAEQRLETISVVSLSPEQAYDRHWVICLLETVKEKLRAEMEASGKAREYEVLKDSLAWNSGESSYQEIAARLSISEGNVKVQVYRARRRFRDLLEDEIRQTLNVSSVEEVHDEIMYLRATLAQG